MSELVLDLPPMASELPVALPDEHLTLDGASCALWWSHSLLWEGEPAGAVGKIEAATEASLVALLRAAAERLRAEGCAYVLGPLDASMWGPHRLVTAPGTADPFALDVDTPAWWPFAFRAAGFSPVAYYVSTEHALGDHPNARIQPVPGLRLRPMEATGGDLRRLHPLLEATFASRPGFVPLTPARFAALVAPYRALVVEDFALVAEDEAGATVGFAFALPDPDGQTLVVRALAAYPQHAGLDAWMLCTLAQHARAQGLGRLVHALMPERDAQHLCAATPGAVRRRYALLAHRLR